MAGQWWDNPPTSEQNGLVSPGVLARVSLEEGIADADRLAIAGWSYGGFTAAWAVSQTTRFRAAVMGAGISHWASFHGKSCLPAWDAIYYQTDPYERGGKFEQFSPITYAADIQTPTLILHGEKDQDVEKQRGGQGRVSRAARGWAP